MQHPSPCPEFPFISTCLHFLKCQPPGVGMTIRPLSVISNRTINRTVETYITTLGYLPFKARVSALRAMFASGTVDWSERTGGTSPLPPLSPYRGVSCKVIGTDFVSSWGMSMWPLTKYRRGRCKMTVPPMCIMQTGSVSSYCTKQQWIVAVYD